MELPPLAGLAVGIPGEVRNDRAGQRVTPEEEREGRDEE